MDHNVTIKHLIVSPLFSRNASLMSLLRMRTEGWSGGGFSRRDCTASMTGSHERTRVDIRSDDSITENRVTVISDDWMTDFIPFRVFRNATSPWKKSA